MYVIPYGDGSLLSVWIQPRASRTMLIGIYGDNVKIAIKSPPIEDRANEECIEFLSTILGLPKRQFKIKSGRRGRRKKIYINEVAPDEVVANLQGAVKKS
ncbi:MAG: YggU family protein [Actinobacteria bacterium]|nr:YggU family protein [Actinomycetota bacterium]